MIYFYFIENNSAHDFANDNFICLDQKPIEHESNITFKQMTNDLQSWKWKVTRNYSR